MNRYRYIFPMQVACMGKTVRLVAPNCADKLRMIDKWIAVALKLKHRLVALSPFDSRIRTMPTFEHIQYPRFKYGAVGAVKNCVGVAGIAFPIGDGIFVAGCHVEVSASKIPFELVNGLKYGAVVA